MVNEILIIIFLAILFDVSNGWNDSANAIATVVSTRVLSPLKAVIMAASMNVLGAFFSTAVAKTIGGGIVSPGAVTNLVVMAALIPAFFWNMIMTKMGMPISCSHALIGGLVGASVAYGGTDILELQGLVTILMSLLVSPLLGIFLGYLFMKFLVIIFGNFAPGLLNRIFGKTQLISSAFLAFSHGSNDAQKAMGIITLALVSGGFLSSLEIPLWVILICAVSMGMGTAFGGWRVIRTLGINMLKLGPIHGFAAETSAAVIILASSHFGLPVSTTHVMASSIMGVGATKRLSAVRWGLAWKIITAWILTLPICLAMGWAAAKILMSLS